MVRARTSLPAELNRQKYRKLILAVWRYKPNGSGMPESHEHKRMQAFEDAIELGPESSGGAVQVAALTGNGLKEWRYYTCDVDRFMEALNEILEGHQPYPIDFDTYDDPDWNALAEIIQLALKPTGQADHGNAMSGLADES